MGDAAGRCAGAGDVAGQQEADEKHEQDAQQQQDQLLDDEPAAVAFCDLRRNSIAAHRMRLKRMRLIRWMMIGALTSSPPAAMY